MARYAVINLSNVITNMVDWNGNLETWAPYPDIDGTPQTAVPDTDPPTAQIGYSYNPGDGTFTPVPEPVTQSPGLISRILSALNPFK
jgi:hypothetical protein